MKRDIPFDEEVAPADETTREEQGDRGFTIDTVERRRKFAEDFDRRIDEDRRRRARRC